MSNLDRASISVYTCWTLGQAGGWFAVDRCIVAVARVTEVGGTETMEYSHGAAVATLVLKIVSAMTGAIL